ncbi:MAG: hypothetical protein LBD44_05955 [Spirochaetaceae bacterium]|nr:hypothetical protein [Spirochaetaceae bacterium]
MSRFRFPILAALALLLSWSCKTVPPGREDVTEEAPPASAEETAEEALPVETPDEQPLVVVRAEEVIEPLDKNVYVDLTEPVYNLNEPEVVEALEEAPLVPDGSDAAMLLDEPVEKPEEAVLDDPSDIADGSSDIAEEPSPAEETVSDDISDISDVPSDIADEPPPPPPPVAALRPSEPPASPPVVPGTPSEPLRAQPVLPARNPPTETERYVKPAVSRTINVKTRQTFEVPFEETGWVYTGEENSRNGVSYDSRRVYGDRQVFVFRAGKEGDYTLKFYKQDFLRDHVTNEYVRVIVEDEAPFTTASPAAVPADAAANGVAADATAEERSDEPPPAAPGNLLREAREAVAAEKYQDAIVLLDRLERQAALNDEAWWLYGQAFEAASPARDIRSALDAYSCIVRDYPQSAYYKNAQNRIAFLNRFYFNIR